MDVIKFPENLKTTSGLSILLHVIISLPEVISYDLFVSLLYVPSQQQMTSYDKIDTIIGS